MCCMHHLFHYVIFKTVRNWLYIFIFLICFYTIKVESERKEQFLFQTSILFFRGIQMRFFKCLKYFDFESETHKQGVPTAFRTLCVLLSLSYGIFMTYSASAQTPAHFLWLKSTGLGSIPASLCRFSCPLRFHLYLSMKLLGCWCRGAPVYPGPCTCFKLKTFQNHLLTLSKHRWNFTSLFSAAGNQNVASASELRNLRKITEPLPEPLDSPSLTFQSANTMQWIVQSIQYNNFNL